MRRVAVALALCLAVVATPAVVSSAAVRGESPANLQLAAAADQKVVFNTKSLKYHCASCSAAKRCTKNCITTTLIGVRRYRTWFRWDFAQPQTEPTFTYSYNIEKVEVNCAAMTYRTLTE